MNLPYKEIIGAASSKALELSSKKIIKPDTPMANESFRNRALLAGIGSISGAGASLALKQIPRYSKFFTPQKIVALGIAGGVAGFASPSIVNRIKKQMQEGKKNKAGEIAFQHANDLLNYKKIVEDSANKHFGIQKHAFIGAAARRVGSMALGAGGFLGSTWMRGMAGAPKSSGFATKALSTGIRLGTAGAIGYGAYRGYKALSAPRSGANYTTYLRNQMLAGNIKSDEVPVEDLEQVRKLGLR